MTRSGMVEGAHLGTCGDDPPDNRVQVVEHIAGWDAQHSEAVPSQHRVTNSVAPGLIPETVTLPIDFNNQPPLQAREIDGHFDNWKLPAELQSSGPAPKHLSTAEPRAGSSFAGADVRASPA
jgi:hypothetical protein